MEYRDVNALTTRYILIKPFKKRTPMLPVPQTMQRIIWNQIFERDAASSCHSLMFMAFLMQFITLLLNHITNSDCLLQQQKEEILFKPQPKHLWRSRTFWRKMNGMFPQHPKLMRVVGGEDLIEQQWRNQMNQKLIIGLNSSNLISNYYFWSCLATRLQRVDLRC